MGSSRKTAAPGDHDAALSRRLLEAAQRGDAGARDAFIEHNLRLVQSIASRFTAGLRPGRLADGDDVFQVGCIGLIKAMEAFDLERPVRFSTYAVPVIAGEIRRFLREQHPVRVSRGLRELAGQVLECRERLEQEQGRTPSVEEVAADLGVAREEVAAALGAMLPPVPWEKDDSGDEPGAPEPAAAEAGAGEHDFIRLVDSLALRQLLEGMEEEERHLVTMRYFDGRPQTEVAEVLGVSQAHVSRLERRILKRLRRLLDP